MTCPYFSLVGENIRCRIYGEIPFSESKAHECYSNYSRCLEEAINISNERLRLQEESASMRKGKEAIIEQTVQTTYKGISFLNVFSL